MYSQRANVKEPSSRRSDAALQVTPPCLIRRPDVLNHNKSSFSQCFHLQPRNTAAFSESNSRHLLPRHKPNSTQPWSARAYSQEEQQSYPVIKPLLVQLQNREMLYIKQIFQYLFTCQYKDNCPYKITDSVTKTSGVRRHKGLLYDKASKWHSPLVWLEACFLYQVFSRWLSLWLKAKICSINYFVRKKEIHLNVHRIPKLFLLSSKRDKKQTLLFWILPSQPHKRAFSCHRSCSSPSTGERSLHRPPHPSSLPSAQRSQGTGPSRFFY